MHVPPTGGKARWLAAVLVAGGCLLGLALHAGGAEQPEPGPALKVGVVDMGRVLRSSEQWRDMAEERARLVQKMRETMQDLTRQVQVLRNEYANLPPGTDEKRQKAAELEQAVRDREQKRQEFEQEVGRSYSRATRRMFQKLSDAVAAYARERGLDLVLKKQSVDLEGPESLGQNIMLATAEVLYAGEKLDVTDAVVERMNAEYPGPVEVK